MKTAPALATQTCAIFRGTAGEEIRFPLAGRDLTEIQMLMCRTHPGCDYLGTEQAGIISPRKDDPDDLASPFIGAAILGAVAGGVSYYLLEHASNRVANLAGYPFAVVSFVCAAVVLWIIVITGWQWLKRAGLRRVFILVAVLVQSALILMTAKDWSYDDYRGSRLNSDTRVKLATCFVFPLLCVAALYVFRRGGKREPASD